MIISRVHFPGHVLVKFEQTLEMQTHGIGFASYVSEIRQSATSNSMVWLTTHGFFEHHSRFGQAIKREQAPAHLEVAFTRRIDTHCTEPHLERLFEAAGIRPYCSQENPCTYQVRSQPRSVQEMEFRFVICKLQRFRSTEQIVCEPDMRRQRYNHAVWFDGIFRLASLVIVESEIEPTSPIIKGR